MHFTRLIFLAVLCALYFPAKAQEVNGFHQLIYQPKKQANSDPHLMSEISYLEVLKKFSLDSCSRIGLLQYYSTIDLSLYADLHPGILLYKHSNRQMVDSCEGRFDLMFAKWTSISNDLQSRYATVKQLKDKTTWIDTTLAGF